jgi:hypothetical protein
MADRKWQGRQLVSRSHVSELERESALREFRDQMPREQAEEQAYQDYQRKHHAEAGAHHLRGLKAAQASGDTEEAKKHGIAYELHLKALGHEPGEGVPDEIRAHVEAPKAVHHKFKAHAGDALLLADQPEEPK